MARVLALALVLTSCTRASPRPAEPGRGARSISVEATPTCPGDLHSPICDVHIVPTCGADEHVRSLACRPVCISTSACLVP